MSRNFVLFLAAILLAPAGVGCATLPPLHDAPLVDDAQGQQHAQAQATYVVELRPHRGERERVEVQFTGVPYIAQALAESGATSKFRRMEVELIRQGPKGPQKMRSSYDHARDRVPMEWDYAIYPNDLIVVTEDPSTMFDDMIESALGPIGFLNRK